MVQKIRALPMGPGPEGIQPRSQSLHECPTAPPLQNSTHGAIAAFMTSSWTAFAGTQWLAGLFVKQVIIC